MNQEQTKHFTLYLGIILITLFGEGRSMAQKLFPFPDSVVQSYHEENYRKAYFQINDVFNNLRQTEPDSMIRHFAPRIACLGVWDSFDNIDHAKSYTQGWQQTVDANSYTPTDEELADFFTLRAVFAYEAGRTQAAIDTMLIAIEHRKSTHPFELAMKADGYQFLGNLYKEYGDPGKSKRFFTEAMATNLLNNRQQANYQIEMEMSTVLFQLTPNDTTILGTLNKSLKQFVEIGKDELASLCHNEIGNYWLSKENDKQALIHFRTFLNTELAFDRSKYLPAAYNNLGACLNRLGFYQEAKNYLKTAAELTPPENFLQLATFYSNLGALYGKLNKPDSALIYLDLAISYLFPNSQNDIDSILFDTKLVHPVLPIILANRANALFEISKTKSKLDQLDESVKFIKEAVKKLDQLRYYASFNSKLYANRENRDIYLLALEIAAERFQMSQSPEDLNLVLEFSSKSKSAIFDEYQRVLMARDSIALDDELVALDDSLKYQQAKLTQEILFLQRQSEASQEDLFSLNRQLIANEIEIKSLSAQLQSRHPSFYNYIHATTIGNIQDIQKDLNLDEVIIDYTYSAERFFRLQISRDSVSFDQVEVDEDFQNIISVYQSFFTQRTKLGIRDFIDLGYQLFCKLLNTDINDLTGKTIILIPDGPLGFLAFDTFAVNRTIPDRKNYNRVDILLNYCTLSYVNSFQQFHNSRASTIEQAVQLMAFAPFTRQDYQFKGRKLGHLIGSQQEVEKIGDLVKGRVFEHKKAQLDEYYKIKDDGHILHLATHGILSAGNPMDNLLIFSPDKNIDHQLRLYQVINQSLQSPLVVLSACDTGTGDLFEGEGIMSLTRGFHSAGADAVIMSLWPAYDQPAVVIMEEFYKAIVRGEPMAEALRTAKLNYLKNCPAAYSHPGLWANYQLSGLNDSLPVQKKNKHWQFYVLSLAVVFTTILIVWLIRTGQILKSKHQ